MREEESHYGKCYCPSSAIAFVSYDIEKLINCLVNTSYDNKLVCENETNRVIYCKKDNCVHNDSIQKYFSNPASEGAYLIAEAYVSKIMGTVKSGSLAVPANTIAKNDDRIWNALSSINQRAGRTVYADNKIYFLDSKNPDYYEKIAILVTHTGNASFNSYAAEVKFHSDGLKNVLSWKYYESCLKSDMAVGEEVHEWITEWFFYYNLESGIVKEQAQYHGEY